MSASEDDDTNSLYLEGKVHYHYSRKHFEAFVLMLRNCVKSRGGRPGSPVPNSPYGLCGRKAALNLNIWPLTTGGHPSKATFLFLFYFLGLVHFVE